MGMDNNVVISRDGCCGEQEEDVGGMNGDELGLDLGGELIMQYTDHVLWNCINTKTCIILLTIVTPNKFNKKRKNKLYIET